MKLPLSLKWFVALTFLTLGLVLVVGYSILSARYFMLGMDNMIAMNMERAAKRYLESGTAHEHNGARQFEGFLVAPQWQQLPGRVRAAFGEPPARSNAMIKQDIGTATPPERLYFLMHYRQGGNTLFITHMMSPETVSSLVEHNIRANLNSLAMISGAIALALAAIVWLLLAQVSRPVSRLGNWTRALNPQRFREPVPDFSYPELNTMAELIRSSLTSVEESLEREHRFLRHASHELRTPITTIRTNVELLRKLQPANGRERQEKAVFDRIDRASLTMKHLTETLLWLGRDNDEPLPQKTFALDRLIRQLTRDLGYLLRDKRVSLDIDTEPCEITQSEVATSIVLGNLIRNAFQHTAEGSVSIRQRGGEVEIVNRQAAGSDDELGFSLGLQLTAQLSERLGWKYENRNLDKGHKASVNLTS